ncbi:cytochrome P450 [Nocardia sp. SYP-A9097]|uniref:cytochrome P450 n=1 Tax=Nocardia sp. SYP-A9097 TaxID=2663237 RepID=UPI001891D96F|nr:cytochrome P450 [Nocardia sp. SYP-A9097]
MAELNTSADIHVFTALGKDFVFVTDPLLINDMLVDRRGDFEKGVFYDRVRRLAGNGVVLANGDEHRRQRDYLDRFFKREHVVGLSELMIGVVRDELARWDSTLDIDAALHRMTFKILAATMFGADIDHAGFDRIHEWLGTVLEAIMFRTVMPNWYLRIPTARNRLHDNAMDQLRAAITAAMDSPGAADPDRLDLISVMRTVRGADGKPLTADEMADQIVAVTMAGAETAATALSWLTVELAGNPTMQEGLRAELAGVRDRGIEYGPDLTETPLLKQVLSELLRCRQPILVISRRTNRDTTLRGVTLPGGTEVMYSPWAMHRDRTHFPAGAAFEPETFGANGCPVTKGSYTPFGLGPRHCVGEQYAWQMMWIVVAEVLAEVRIESAAAQHPKGRPLATIIPGTVDATVRRLPTTVGETS